MRFRPTVEQLGGRVTPTTSPTVSDDPLPGDADGQYVESVTPAAVGAAVVGGALGVIPVLPKP